MPSPGLADQNMAQFAIAWVLRLQGMTSALIGASSVKQLEENVAALDRLGFFRRRNWKRSKRY